MKKNLSFILKTAYNANPNHHFDILMENIQEQAQLSKENLETVKTNMFNIFMMNSKKIDVNDVYYYEVFQLDNLPNYLIHLKEQLDSFNILLDKNKLNDIIQTNIIKAAKKNYYELLIIQDNQGIPNIEKEKNALLSYIPSRWEKIREVEKEALAKIIDLAIEKTEHILETSHIMSFVHNNIDKIKDIKTWWEMDLYLTEEEAENNSKNHIVSLVNFNLLLSSFKLQHATLRGQWDYEKECNAILATIKKQYPSITKIKPIGWRAFKKAHTDFAGMQEYSNEQYYQDLDDFDGMYTGTASSYTFVQRIALPYVANDDINQGRNSLTTLVGAIVGHFYTIMAKNNDLLITKELKNVYDIIYQDKFFHQEDITIEEENKILNIFQNKYYKDVFKKEIAKAINEYKENLIEEDLIKQENSMKNKNKIK